MMTKKTIIVTDLHICADKQETRVSVKLSGASEGGMWFGVKGGNWQFLAQHADAFVIPVFLHALHLGANVHLRFPVSHRLVSNLNDALGPLLVRFARDLFPETVSISSDTYLWGDTQGFPARGSATGMSCGLDSFATVSYAMSFPPESKRQLSLLTHFDVGNHAPLPGTAPELCEQRVKRAEMVASLLGLDLLVVDSNIGDFIPGSFARLHTFRNLSAAFLAYPRASTYFYSNGVKITDTTLDANDSAYADAIFVPLLSTDFMRVEQGTPSMGAPEKAALIAGNKVAQQYLNVCYFKDKNCGECEKCLRRALLFESLGALDDFSMVLDPEVFRRNRRWYIGYVLMRGPHSPVMQELAEHLRRTGVIKGIGFVYRVAWLVRRIENRIMRFVGKPRRPL